MSFSRIISFQADISGSYKIDVDVENHAIEKSLTIIGLPDKAVKESKDRVLSALRSIKSNDINHGIRTITVSLAPAEIPKHGPYFDLPIAIGILETIGIIKKSLVKRAYVGELGLDGRIRPIRGALSISHTALKNNIEELYIPKENAKEAALISDIKIIPVENLSDLIWHISGKKEILKCQEKTEYKPEEYIHSSYLSIKGQESAKRGLQIAAAGGHNIALYGPPGTGKTLLARSLIELLPPLSESQMIETTMLESFVGILKGDYVSIPPFRAPHHSASVASIIGGGPNIKPGEIALANNGILFMDEFPEFQTPIIESLREPLEDGKIRVSRVKGTTQFKTRFTLIIAMNPCPCGFLGDEKKECSCSQNKIDSYKRKLSGPIVDRIDMWICVPRISHDELMNKNEININNLSEIKNKIKKVREFSYNRNGEGKLNAHLNNIELEKIINLNDRCKNILSVSSEKLLLSPRAIHRTIRLARTIADLDEENEISEKHLIEALSYRRRE